MEQFQLIASSLYFLAIFVFGWICLTIIVGIRGGVEGGFRFFLLGFGLFVAFVATIAILLNSPDWLAIILMLLGAFLPWVSMLQYFVNTRRSGDLLMALPSKHEKWSNSVIGGIVFVLFGLLTFIFNDPLTSQKIYTLGVLCISWGAFGVVQRIRFSQIREKGILYEFGSLYSWENIESYTWKFGEDKLSLKLKRSLFRRNVNLRLPSRFRQEVVSIFSKKIDYTNSNGQEFAPTSKAG
jgi:hypothetical protein